MTIFAPINDGLNGWSRTGLSAMIDNYWRVPTEGRRMTTMISEVYSAFKTAGVPEQEAKQAAEALSAENLATKDTVAENKHDLSAEIATSRQQLTGQIAEVRQEIAQVKQELTSQIAEVRQELTEQIAEVRQEIAQVKQELTSQVAEVRQELTEQIAEVRQEIAQVKQELSSKIGEIRQAISGEIGEIKRTMSVMQWMLGLVLLAVVLPILRDAVS